MFVSSDFRALKSGSEMTPNVFANIFHDCQVQIQLSVSMYARITSAYYFVMALVEILTKSCFVSDSTNSGDNMYTLMNAVPPGPNRPNVNIHFKCI